VLPQICATITQNTDHDKKETFMADGCSLYTGGERNGYFEIDRTETRNFTRPTRRVFLFEDSDGPTAADLED
jgi:hypothetical protein